MTGCRFIALEAYLHGELGADREEAVEEHVAGCVRCRGELAWLRAERRLFSERARLDRAALPAFEEVLARSGRLAAAQHEPKPLPLRWGGAARVSAGLAAAAALMALAGRDLLPPPAPTPRMEEIGAWAEPLASIAESTMAGPTCSGDDGMWLDESAGAPSEPSLSSVDDEHDACTSMPAVHPHLEESICEGPPL